MRQSVSRYLKIQPVLGYSKSQMAAGFTNSRQQRLSRNFGNAQGEVAHEDAANPGEELAVELLFQGQSYPRFYFKNLSF